MENQNEKLIKYSFQFNNSIRVFISLYKFKQELSKKKSEILSKEVYLLNKNWFNTYKDFYLFDRIYDLINYKKFILTFNFIITVNFVVVRH